MVFPVEGDSDTVESAYYRHCLIVTGRGPFASGKSLRGFAARVLALVNEWRSARRKELLADWERARLRQPLAYIEPLE